MTELASLIGPDGVAAAGATWFASKVAGPSAGAIGDNLKAYLQSRIPSIFGVAEMKARDAGIEIGPIKPGLLSRMVVDASFSEDEPTITEWWANLFLSAAKSGDNRHAVFSDIMATVGPSEAAVLQDLVESYRIRLEAIPTENRADLEAIGPLMAQTTIQSLFNLPENPQQQADLDRLLADPPLPFPVRTCAWSYPTRVDGGRLSWSVHTEDWYKSARLQTEILERSSILRYHRTTLPILADTDAWLDFIEVTDLGLRFFDACTGNEK